jgi:hypothetical protein
MPCRKSRRQSSTITSSQHISHGLP